MMISMGAVVIGGRIMNKTVVVGTAAVVIVAVAGGGNLCRLAYAKTTI